MTTSYRRLNVRSLLVSSVALLWLLSAAPAVRVLGAEPIKQKIEIPAGPAERSVRSLSEQTGAEILYPTNVAREVRTNAVAGELTPGEALDRMLAGTGLVAVHDEKTNAFTVRKETLAESKNGASRPAIDRAASVSGGSRVGGRAESRTKPEASEEGRSSVVRMSAFEVRTTEGTGYSAGNAASALKSSQNLMDIPQQIIVVTSDLVRDIGYVNASDVLQFAGLSARFRGTSIQSRGNIIANPFLDDIPQSLPSGIDDNYNIDSYEIIKGPVQIFYPLASLGGAVLKRTKKPLLGVRQYVFDAQINEYGGHREVFDLNGPAGSLGGGQLTYRLVGAYQSDTKIFTNTAGEHECINPTLQWDWNGTTVSLAYDHQKLNYAPAGTSVLTPTGGLYTGAGRRVSGSPRNNEDDNERQDVRLAWTQRFSPDWQMKFQAIYWDFDRYGSVAFPTGVNWNTNMLTYTARLDNGTTTCVVVQGDVQGKYQIGNLANQSAFGFNWQDANSISKYWPASPFTIPAGSAAAIDSIQLLPPSAIPQPANPGSRSQQYVGNVYYMHTLDVIPNWVTLVAGLTYSKIESISAANISVSSPYATTDLPGHDILNRYGVIVHLTKELMAYWSQSETFQTSAGVDYNNTPLPLIKGVSDEVGLKTSFWNGQISSSVAAYRMTLSNQAILAPFPAVNVAGAVYYFPIGTTRSEGFDGSISLELLPRWQTIATFYQGTVKDQNNNPVSATYENSWSIFSRYDFDSGGPLRGWSFGAGAARLGGRWLNKSGITMPGGAANPVNSSGVALFKLHEGTIVNAFVNYRVNRHLDVRVQCQNVLDEAYPLGAQGVGLVDPSEPRHFVFSGTYRY